ncbi:MAG: type II toxin-antitoxin system HicB family antitoxin [Desulfobacteraceae bacterium]|jgi:antitoxin HicB
MEFKYPAKIQDDGCGGFLVVFRDIPFAATEGKTIKEALTQAVDCLEEAIASCIDDGELIPKPSKPQKNEYQIMLPAQTAAKTALYIAVKKTGISNSELARRINVDEKEVRRMLNPRHPTKLPRIEKALASLGHHLSVTLLENAA